jgi:hypothetical protein
MTETDTNHNANEGSASKKEIQTEVFGDDCSFRPLNLHQEKKETSDAENEQRIQESLKTLKEETSELSVSLAEESRLINDICLSLAQALKKLDVSVNIPAREMPVDKKIRKIVLNQDGSLKFSDENGEVQSAILSEYPPEMVMAVVRTVIPELAKITALYRRRVKARLSFFEEVRKELRTIMNAITGKTEKKPSQIETHEPISTAEETPKDETAK